ncbi:MAG: hypothetical protein GWN00_37665, partial [Aliifodinibius sp.]|nr:hypothetical protein [Fodinibius sp.]NIY30308.1 hypothetical protein [Fodinibius sp.]
AVLEKAYDDGQINFSVSTQGIAANKFEFPGEDFNLSGIRFFNPQSHTPLKIHIYDSRNGLPGNSLVQPLDTLIFSGDSWIEIGVAEEVN